MVWIIGAHSTSISTYRISRPRSISWDYAEYFEPSRYIVIKLRLKAWTWDIPRKYDLRDAILVDPSGKVATNFQSEPLCVRSGSISVDSKISFFRIKKHIMSNSDIPELAMGV